MECVNLGRIIVLEQDVAHLQKLLMGEPPSQGLINQVNNNSKLAIANRENISSLITLLRGEPEDFHDTGLIGAFGRVSVDLKRVLWLLSLVLAAIMGLWIEQTTGIIANFFN